jgi:hypothetical protein
VNLSSSSDEEGPIPDTSRDEEFAKKLFGDLNRDVLGPPGDDKIIILSDSVEEEEVHEEDVADTKAVPSSAARILASTASTIDGDEASTRVQDDKSGDHTINREAGSGSNNGDEVGLP